MKTIERLRKLLAKATPGPWTTGWNEAKNRHKVIEMVVGPQKRDALPALEGGAE